MRLTRLSVVVLASMAGGSSLAAAGEVELAVFAGPSIPTYEQSFRYDPGTIGPLIPGVTVRQQSTFDLVAKGGLAAGGSLAFFPTSAFGIEARVDTVGIDVTTTGARFTASVSLPPPLPSFSTDVALTGGQVDLDRLTPITLGVKLRTPGRVRIFGSAGMSYLPKVAATVSQPVGVGIGGAEVLVRPIDVGTFTLRAEAEPTSSQGRWGWSAGAGIQVPVHRSVALQAEGRFFRFAKQTLVWGPGEAIPFVPGAQDLVKAAIGRLDPVEFSPTFFQATAGVAFRF